MEFKGQTSCQLVLTDVCPFCVLMVLVFCFGGGKNRGVYGIAYFAKLSFLAGTRNLMIMPVGCVFDLSPALCCHWGEIPGPCQG